MNRKQKKLPANTDTPELKLQVSFELLDLGDKEFCAANCTEAKQLHWALEHLHELCKLTRLQLIQQKNRFDYHAHEWMKTSRKRGFDSVRHLDEEHLAEKAYQIAISAKARLHGVFIDHVFFPIWVDIDHGLYPTH